MSKRSSDMARLTLPVSDTRDHIQGAPTAAVTLLEYGDYECPDCLQAYPIMHDIQEHFGQQLRLVFRNFPVPAVHPHAQRAAEAAEAAGAQGKFWELHDILYEHQHALDDHSLRQYARQLGLDLRRFERELEIGTHAARVEEDRLSGIESGVTGTPTFFINGTRHRDPWDLETLITAIDANRKPR
jgi:protein-disulfide isomerase